MSGSDEEAVSILENKVAKEFEEKCLPFKAKTELTDLVLKVKDQPLYVNKTMLMLASPVFRKMFSSDFKEKSMDEISLPDKEMGDVVAFLRCIHPEILDLIDGDNAFKVIPLADEYHCMTLKNRAEQCLVSRIERLGTGSSYSDDRFGSAINDAIKCTLLAEKYTLDRLLQAGVKFLYQQHSFHLKGPEFSQISEKLRFLIFKKRMFFLEKKCKIQPSTSDEKQKFSRMEIDDITVD